jgi:hypothetical protein
VTAASAVPDYAAPLEAWRVWRVGLRDGEFVLESLFAGATWLPNVPLRATCAAGHRSRLLPWRIERNSHRAPELHCTCGIYGVSSEGAAREYLEARRFITRDDRVLGRVALWGDVVEATAGWRASTAYPLELLVPFTTTERRGYHDDLLTGLGAYGVPVQRIPARTAVGVLVG